MASTRQLGVRQDESDKNNLKRVAEIKGRSEQDVLREPLRIYVRSVEEQQGFITSVELGWHELHSGLGELVAGEDGFFDSIRKEISE